MFDYSEYRIFLSCGKTDMRKSINGLCDIVQFKFALDPRIQLLNNLEEQSIKMFVIGRKKYSCGASASASIYGIIQTAIANTIKPLYYLEYIFEQLQLDKNLDVNEILPWSDKIQDSCKTTMN